MSALWLVTAPRGAGKTTFCRIFADHARREGWDVSGLLSPAAFELGVKTGIRAVSLRTGETCLLASAELRPPFDLPLGRWFFDKFAIEWGNRILAACLPSDLFLVDELGPLELLRGAGWISALSALNQPRYRLGLAVVRLDLVEAACAALPVAGMISLEKSGDLQAQSLRWWRTLSGGADG